MKSETRRLRTAACSLPAVGECLGGHAGGRDKDEG